MDPAASVPELPPWASELVELYESGASSQFIVHGNVQDRMLVPGARGPRLGDLKSFLLNVLLPRFDVVLSFDLGSGIRIEKGGQVFSTWPNLKESAVMPRAPRPAIDFLTHYFRYTANLSRLGQQKLQVACLVFGSDLALPASPNATDFELGAAVTLVRDWANEDLLSGHTLATFLICENLHDLHPLVSNNLRTSRIRVPLPSSGDMAAALNLLMTDRPAAPEALSQLAGQLVGTSLGAVERTVLARRYAHQEFSPGDVIRLKRSMVENDCNGLIDFLEPRKTLNDLYGLDKVKAWLRQDVVLWAQGDLNALPKGYLICGPVGTGKTFLVECLAGEAGVPVVRMKNFRDKWVGSTEGNLERIFRLIHALGRCYVFIDEADQALGRRDSASGDSGVSGRVYSMIAEEMGSSANRGRIIWVLASSRPDLIEVDLKRPGRVDVKIPLLPTTTAREGFDLIRTLMRTRGLEIEEPRFAALEPIVPEWLTPGAAESLAVKVYRLARTTGQEAFECLRLSLAGYRNPVPRDILEAQIRLAVREASDLAFVPTAFQSLG